MVIETFLLSGVRGNSILSDLDHFFYTFELFLSLSLTSIVTLQLYFIKIRKIIDKIHFL